MNVEHDGRKKLLLQIYECFLFLFLYTQFLSVYFSKFLYNFFFICFIHLLLLLMLFESMQYVCGEWIFTFLVCVSFHSISDTGQNEVIELSRLLLSHSNTAAAAVCWLTINLYHINYQCHGTNTQRRFNRLFKNRARDCHITYFMIGPYFRRSRLRRRHNRSDQHMQRAKIWLTSKQRNQLKKQQQMNKAKLNIEKNRRRRLITTHHSKIIQPINPESK